MSGIDTFEIRTRLASVQNALKLLIFTLLDEIDNLRAEMAQLKHMVEKTPAP